MTVAPAPDSPHEPHPPSSLISAVGQNLRAIRLSRGLTQQALADQTGYHRAWIGSIEQGSRNLQLRSVERLADRLGVPVMRLLRPLKDAPPVRSRPGRPRSSDRS